MQRSVIGKVALDLFSFHARGQLYGYNGIGGSRFFLSGNVVPNIADVVFNP